MNKQRDQNALVKRTDLGQVLAVNSGSCLTRQTKKTICQLSGPHKNLLLYLIDRLIIDFNLEKRKLH